MIATTIIITAIMQISWGISRRYCGRVLRTFQRLSAWTCQASSSAPRTSHATAATFSSRRTIPRIPLTSGGRCHWSQKTIVTSERSMPSIVSKMRRGQMCSACRLFRRRTSSTRVATKTNWTRRRRRRLTTGRPTWAWSRYSQINYLIRHPSRMS